MSIAADGSASSPIAIPFLSTEISSVFGAQPEIDPADDMHVSRTNT